MNLPVLHPAMPGCTLCELHEGRKSPGIPTELIPGSSNRALFVVGQNPGLSEDIEGRPFVGRAGDFVRRVILAPLAPFSLNVYLAHTARCATASTTTIKPRSYTTCFSFTLTDLMAVAAHFDTYVLALGAPASAQVTHSLMGTKLALKDAFNKNGTRQPIPGQTTHITFFSTYHPSAVLRSPPLLHPVSDHVTMLVRSLEGTAPTISAPTFISPRLPL